MLRIEKYSFSILHFFNMDILLIMRLTIIKIAIHVTETYWEGSISQNFDIVFVLSHVEKWIFNNNKKYKSCPSFALKMKLGPKQRI